MENVLYNDLIRRGMNVDVGVVEYNTKDANGKKIRKQLEVDFVVNQGGKRFYVQSALSIADPEKKEQEIESLKRIPDSFSKIVVVRDYLKPWQDENGITYVGIEQFLLNEDLLKWDYDNVVLDTYFTVGVFFDAYFKSSMPLYF